MARLKRKRIFDAGVSNPTEIPEEINDQGGTYVRTPRSSYAINEPQTLVFTNKVIEGTQYKLDIPDGGVRPGTTG